MISLLDLRLEQIINRHEWPFATTNTRSTYCIIVGTTVDYASFLSRRNPRGFRRWYCIRIVEFTMNLYIWIW